MSKAEERTLEQYPYAKRKEHPSHSCQDITELGRCAVEHEQKSADKVEPIVVRDFCSVFSREQVEEIDKRIEESQRLYNAKLRDAMRKVEDFPMTD